MVSFRSIKVRKTPWVGIVDLMLRICPVKILLMMGDTYDQLTGRGSDEITPELNLLEFVLVANCEKLFSG